jgi:hypothetical protein
MSPFKTMSEDEVQRINELQRAPYRKACPNVWRES